MQLYTIHDISMKTGIRIPTLYKRVQSWKVTPKIVAGVSYFNDEDVIKLSTPRRRGRVKNAQETQQENAD